MLHVDRPMQLNHGRFLMNGSCGYVLMPDCMRNPAYNPFDWHSFKAVGIVPMTLQITVSTLASVIHVGRAC